MMHSFPDVSSSFRVAFMSAFIWLNLTCVLRLRKQVICQRSVTLMQFHLETTHGGSSLLLNTVLFTTESRERHSYSCKGSFRISLLFSRRKPRFTRADLSYLRSNFKFDCLWCCLWAHTNTNYYMNNTAGQYVMVQFTRENSKYRALLCRGGQGLPCISDILEWLRHVCSSVQCLSARLQPISMMDHSQTLHSYR